MADILLAHSYFLRYDQKQFQKMRPYPPLATLYAAAALRAAGYEVALFDAMLAEGEHEFAAALTRHRPRMVALYEDNFNFLSKMCLTRMREAACAMLKLARQSGALALAAGPDVSDHPEIYLQAGAHAALLGEPDHTLVDVVAALGGTELPALAAISGLALLDESGALYRTARRPVERRPDVFPNPAWDLIDIERYRSAWTQAHNHFSLNMVSTRGCPFHCNWCAKPTWGQRYAMRSPTAVAEELAYLKANLRPDHIWFADDIFGLRPQWVAEFGREVAARNAAVPFMIQSRADLMTDEAVAGLKQAGCVEVWMGAESGSQKVLDAMEKGVTVAELHAARARLGAAGIRACFFIQLGYPGETFEDLMATVALIREALPDNIGVSVSYPLPGTRFYELVRAQLGAQTNWIDSGDLAMMFQGTYRSPFYRHMHRLLHLDLELRQRLAAGAPSAALAPALEELNAAWLELGRLEASERSAAPTVIARSVARIAAPDLSKEYN